MSDVTYLKDVAPILERRCASCHAAGGFAGVPLDSYQHAREWARQIREEVLERRMPPWPAAPGFGDFRNDQSLSLIEVELLTAWADGGTPLGAAGRLTTGRAPAPAAGDTVTVTLPDGDPGRGSVARIDLPADFGSKRWIAGWEYRPGDAEVEQYAEFFVDGARIGSWVPSQRSVTYPPGITVAARKRARLSAEVRYRKSETRNRPGGRLTLRFSAGAGEQPSRLALRCGENRIARSVRALGITPYAPADGESVEIVARDPQGQIDPLCVVPRYRPDWPLTYEFRAPLLLAGGTVIDVRSSSPGCSAGLDVIAALPARGAARGR